MDRGSRGPNIYKVFEEQPPTSNGIYGFEVLRELHLTREQALNRDRLCCPSSPFLRQRVPCGRHPPRVTDLVATNPRVNFSIAPRLHCGHKDPYTPKANRRDIYVGDRCSEVKAPLVECRERNTEGTITMLNAKAGYYVAPRLKSSRGAPWICSCDDD